MSRSRSSMSGSTLPTGKSSRAWAMNGPLTWGRGDVLYTGNNDGTSFGGMPNDPIAFRKMEGGDPYHLKGTTVTAMHDFREPPQLGPQGALWKTMDSYNINGVLYRFVSCGPDADLSASSCIITSSDGGSPLFRSGNFSAPSFITYRKEMEVLLGGGPAEYTYAAS